MLEIPRLLLVAIIFGIASYHDVRTREIPDYLWIIGCGAGALLYIFDWDMVDLFVIFSMGTGCVIAALVWRLFPMGDADVLAILTVSVAYPVSFGGVMNPVVVFFGGVMLEHMAALAYNMRYNMADAVRSGGLYGDVGGSRLAKVMAFYSMHRRRDHEKFTFCAERISGGKRMLSLKTPPADSEYESRTGVFVVWAMPALPFMLAALLLGVLAAAQFGWF